jgi:hypothetical protein
MPWGHSRLYRYLLLILFGALVRGVSPGAQFSGFGDLNSPDTFPLIQMATFDLLGLLVGEASPGAPFSGFGDLNSPGTFPLIQMATFEAFGGSGG